MREVGLFLDEQRRRGNSRATVDYYRQALTRFVTVTGVKKPSDVTAKVVMGFRERLMDQGLSPHTVKSYDRALRIWVRWLKRNKLIKSDPFEDMPRVKVPRGSDLVTFTFDDVDRMLEVTSRPGKQNRLRDKAIIATLLDTGMRVGELASLKMHGVRWNDKILMVKGKTGFRQVPVNRSLKHLHTYIARERTAQPGVDAVFTTRSGTPLSAPAVTHLVRLIAKEAGVSATKLGPHTFRHTFAVEYLKNGGDVFSLKQILGHSDLETTEKYVHWLMGDVIALHGTHSPGARWLH